LFFAINDQQSCLFEYSVNQLLVYTYILLLLLCIHAVGGDWESHHDHLAYVGYEADYPEDDYDELELQEVYSSWLFSALFAECVFWLLVLFGSQTNHICAQVGTN